MKYQYIMLIVAALTMTASADTYIKDNNSDPLTLGSSWVSGSAPGAGDIALWDGSLSAANTSALGADWTLGQIQITSPSGKVTISGNNTLTLNNGMDLAAATQELEISAHLLLGAAQTWAGATASKQLTISGSLTGGAALTITGQSDVNLKGNNTGFNSEIYWNTAQSKTLTISHANALGNSMAAIYVGGGAGALVLDAGADGVNVIRNVVLSNGRSLQLASNGRTLTFSGSLAGTGELIKSNWHGAGAAIVSGSSSLTLNKIEVDAGEMIISGSIYSANGTKVEFANSGGTLTVSGVLDRNGDSAAIIRATSNNNTSAINVSGSGLFNVRGQTTIGTAYGSSTNNTLNINLSNSGTFNATSWVNVSPVKGQIVNLNLSGTSVFKATEISLNEGGNTVSDGKACVNVSVADNALFQSTGILHIGRTSENVETNLVQTGGTVKAQRIRLNDVANKQQNVGIYQLNGGVMLISSDGNSRADNNRNIGDSAITVGADSFVYLNGGTIAVNGNNNASNGTASGTGRMIIQDGGVTIDTQVTGDDYGFAANLALEHGGVNAKDGGLVKTGVGTLLLNAANTYTGDTIVNAGTLILGDAEALGAGGDLRLFNGVTVSLSYSGVADLDALWFNDVIVSSLNIGQSYTAAELNNALSTTIFTGVGSLSITQIPEPSTLTLLLIGAGLLTVSAARRRKCER